MDLVIQVGSMFGSVAMVSIVGITAVRLFALAVYNSMFLRRGSLASALYEGRIFSLSILFVSVSRLF